MVTSALTMFPDPTFYPSPRLDDGRGRPRLPNRGVDLLRRGWINMDLIWSVALIGAGLLTVLSAG